MGNLPNSTGQTLNVKRSGENIKQENQNALREPGRAAPPRSPLPIQGGAAAQPYRVHGPRYASNIGSRRFPEPQPAAGILLAEEVWLCGPVLR